MRNFTWVLASCALAIPVSSEAALITWNAPVALGDGSDVVNLGQVVEAQYAGSGQPSQTVNGVTFTGGFSNYATPGGVTSGAKSRGGNLTNTGNAAYDNVLNWFAYDGHNPNVLTVTGLTIGTTYSIQLWALDTSAYSYRTESFSVGSPTTDASATFHLYGPQVSVSGSFVADATTEVIDVNGVGQSQTNLNAFAVTTVPEPATLGLIALAGIPLAARRRRR